MTKYGWQSPSNIALIKYWGKHGVQLPANPSVSFTLDTCHTKTYLEFHPKTTEETYSVEVFLDEVETPSFAPKIIEFFKRIEGIFPFVKDFHFVLHTHNSFPHSSGIASSASGMSALALCLTEHHLGIDHPQFWPTASEIARLGSGSACRSVYGGLVNWGTSKHITGSNDEFGTQVNTDIHPVFADFKDTILLIDKGEKKVSSTVGHGLMHGHPFASARFNFADDHLGELLDAMQKGDLEKFGHIVEREALMLHSLMMSSSPYFVLMRPNTLAVLDKIWDFRKETGTPLFFTLDAGANIHLLYPAKAEQPVMEFVKNEAIAYCKDKEYLCDQVGSGPQKLI